jgi:H+/gluconate symporter-like permease
MKTFIVACVAAIIIAVVGGVALNNVPDTAEKAFSSSTGVRLGA